MNLKEFADEIADLRKEALCEEEFEDLPIEAKQFYLLAIGSLEQAERFLSLSHSFNVDLFTDPSPNP